MDRSYFRRDWLEGRGDEFAPWGRATYWFETDEQLYPVRQIEVYEGGQRLLYDDHRPDDEFGSLSTVSLADWGTDLRAYEVSAAQFEAEWAKGPPT